MLTKEKRVLGIILRPDFKFSAESPELDLNHIKTFVRHHIKVYGDPL